MQRLQAAHVSHTDDRQAIFTCCRHLMRAVAIPSPSDAHASHRGCRTYRIIMSLTTMMRCAPRIRWCSAGMIGWSLAPSLCKLQYSRHRVAWTLEC
jgi:hypothetical protein